MIIVGICGASGSGKSTLAKRISDSLACSCVIIGQDCYYRNFPELPLEKRVKMNYDEPEIFDFDEMYRDVEMLERGEPIPKKGYDYTNYLRAELTGEQIQPPEVLILEGIHMFHDKRICEMMSLKVFLHVDVDVCLLRRIKRDIKARGRSIDNISEQYLETVKPVYEKYIAHYIDDADFAVMRGGKNKMAIDAISAYLTTKVLAERFELENALQGQSESCGAGALQSEAYDSGEIRDGADTVRKPTEEKDEPIPDNEKNDGDNEEPGEEPVGDRIRERPSRIFWRRPLDLIGYAVSLLVMNAFLAVFCLFMFGKVLGFDWTILQQGGVQAMLDAVVQVFFLFLPLIVTLLFNRFLYRSFRLEQMRSSTPAAIAVMLVVAVQAGTMLLVLHNGFLGGATAFGMDSLVPFPLW